MSSRDHHKFNRKEALLKTSKGSNEGYFKRSTYKLLTNLPYYWHCIKWNGIVSLWNVNAIPCRKEDQIIWYDDVCFSYTNKGLLFIACKLFILQHVMCNFFLLLTLKSHLYNLKIYKKAVCLASSLRIAHPVKLVVNKFLPAAQRLGLRLL